VSTVRLRHDAFIYASEDEFAHRMTAFVEEGLDGGAAAVAVTTPRNWAALRDELGARAADVHFTPRDQFYIRPAKTLAAYDATFRHHLSRGAPEVRVVAEVQFGPTRYEWREWTAYEALSNVAFADRPSWIVCAYDTRALPSSVVQSARRTHPHVMSDGRKPSGRYDHPEQLVRSLQPDHNPLPSLRAVGALQDPRRFREALAGEMAAVGTPETKALDMLVAANEVVANAAQHGGGVTMVRMGAVDGRFVCEVTDSGPGLDDPFAGYLPPARGRDGGRGAGLWVARQLTSRVELLSEDPGLTVRLWL
jgi:anti-sigma regulatory factor (Ser/Thr protein kinase)